LLPKPGPRGERAPPAAKQAERAAVARVHRGGDGEGEEARATLFIGPPASRLHDGIRVGGGEDEGEGEGEGAGRGGVGRGGYSYFGAFHN
jgi:hypothetical protein